MPIERKRNLIHHPVGLKVVDLASCIDHRQVEIKAFGNIFKVKRIKRNTVPPNARPRIEGLETIRLRFRRLDHFPDIDLHLTCKQRKFIDERNVHKPVGVLKNLHHLSRTRRAHRIKLLNCLAIERKGNLLRLFAQRRPPPSAYCRSCRSCCLDPPARD